MTTTKPIKFLDTYRLITIISLIIIVIWMGYKSYHSNNEYAISYEFKLTVIGIFLILGGIGKTNYLQQNKQAKEAYYAFYGMIIHVVILFSAIIIYNNLG